MSKVLKSTYFGHAWLCTPKMIRSTKTFVFIWRQKFILILHGPFFPKFGQNEFFWKKKLLLVFKYSNYLPSCKKWEETNHQFLRKMPNKRTDRQTGNQTDKQTRRQAERQTAKRTDKQRWFYRAMRETGV